MKVFLNFLDCNNPPSPPANGVLLGVDQIPDSAGTYPLGAVATYLCTSNSVAQGNTAVTCIGGGAWEALTLTCTQGKIMHKV